MKIVFLLLFGQKWDTIRRNMKENEIQYEGNYKVLRYNFLFSLKKRVLFWLVDGKMKKYERTGIWYVKVFHYGFVLPCTVLLLLESWNSKGSLFFIKKKKKEIVCENIIFIHWVKSVKRRVLLSRFSKLENKFSYRGNKYSLRGVCKGSAPRSQ